MDVSNNRLYSNTMRQNVLHVYNNIKNLECDKEMQEDDFVKGETIELKIPDQFKQSGYCNNFKQDFKSITDEGNHAYTSWLVSTSGKIM